MTQPGAHLLDLTRLISRMGRGALTGIDRVELAYLDHFLAGDVPLFGVVRTKIGFVLLGRHGCAQIGDCMRGRATLPNPGPIARLISRRPEQQAATALARRLSIARRPFAGALAHKMPSGTVYWNVGHSNLSARMLAPLARAGIKIAVLIHDTIPLDYPQYCRPDQIAPFARKIKATARFADVVIHISAAARARTQAHLAASGRLPAGVTAHLGINLPQITAPPAAAPYFIALGTIEPRKNHAFLFDIWEQLGPDAPHLKILGAKGWASLDLFARMDALIATGKVSHLADLDDTAAMTQLAGARALLFPSHAEGFGLPLLEAAALGVPVIANDLPVFREVIGDLAVYLHVTDSYSWVETIKQLAQSAAQPRQQRPPPNWADHFKSVLTAIG